VGGPWQHFAYLLPELERQMPQCMPQRLPSCYRLGEVATALRAGGRARARRPPQLWAAMDLHSIHNGLLGRCTATLEPLNWCMWRAREERVRVWQRTGSGATDWAPSPANSGLKKFLVRTQKADSSRRQQESDAAD
jgi:hypothetical protein